VACVLYSVERGRHRGSRPYRATAATVRWARTGHRWPPCVACSAYLHAAFTGRASNAVAAGAPRCRAGVPSRWCAVALLCCRDACGRPGPEQSAPSPLRARLYGAGQVQSGRARPLSHRRAEQDGPRPPKAASDVTRCHTVLYLRWSRLARALLGREGALIPALHRLPPFVRSTTCPHRPTTNA